MKEYVHYRGLIETSRRAYFLRLYLPNIIFCWLFGNFASCTLIALTSQSSQDQHTCALSPQKEEKSLKSNLCYPYTHLSIVNLPIKESWFPPHPYPHQKPSVTESYGSSSLSQLLRALIDSLLSRQLIFWGWDDFGGCFSFSTVSLYSSIPLRSSVLVFYNQQNHEHL